MMGLDLELSGKAGGSLFRHGTTALFSKTGMIGKVAVGHLWTPAGG
jgi:hypothetical protein